MESTKLNHQPHSSFDSSEKLSMIRLNNGDFDGDFKSDAGTVGAHRGAADFSMSGLLRRTSRRQSSVLRTSRGMEFSSYVKFSSGAHCTSRKQVYGAHGSDLERFEGSSLSQKCLREKVHEREMFLQERETLLAQTTELTAKLASSEEERAHHGGDVADTKKRHERLLAELSAAIASVTEEKQRVSQRDIELAKVNTELRDVRESMLRHHAQYEKSRKDLEALGSKLKIVEEERDSARADSERYHRESTKATRERTDITIKLTEVISSFKASRKEVLSVTDRLKVAESDREEGLQTLRRFQEELKRVMQKAADDASQVIEVTEKYEKATQEITRLRETVSVVETERDEHHQTITRTQEELKRVKQRAVDDANQVVEATEKYDRVTRELARFRDTLNMVETVRDEHIQTAENLRRQIKNHQLEHDELEVRYGDAVQRHDATKRELLAIKESLRSVELARSQDQESHERTRESVHTLTLERGELNDELSSLRRRIDEHTRQHTLVSDNLRKTEETIVELRTEITTLNEKAHHAHRERDEVRDKFNSNLSEISRLRERIMTLEHDVRSENNSRASLHSELERLRSEYSEVTETVTTFRDDSEELEQELDALKVMLHEAQEQRDRAVSARDSADRERDEYIARYEDKCREIERVMETSFSRSSSYLHSGRKSGVWGGETRTSCMVTSRSVSHAENSGSHEQSSSNMHSPSDQQQSTEEGSNEVDVTE